MHLQKRLKTAVTTIMITGMILITLLWVATTVSRADTHTLNALDQTVNSLMKDLNYCGRQYDHLSSERDDLRAKLFDANVRVMIMGLIGLLGGLMGGYLIGRRNGLMLAEQSPGKVNYGNQTDNPATT